MKATFTEVVQAKIQELYQVYFFYSEDANLQGCELVECGEIELVSNEALFTDFMTWWGQVYIDALLEQAEQYQDEYGCLMDMRGVSFGEWKQLFDSSISEDEFSQYRAFEFFCVLDNIQRKESFLSVYTESYEDYIKALRSVENVVLDFFLKARLKARLPIPVIRENIHITGGAGSGKSQIMTLIYYYLQDASTSLGLSLIEPSGELSKRLLFLKPNKENRERIVYVNPYINKMLGVKDMYVPIINPFEIKERSEQNISTLSQALASAFVMIIGDDELSLNMKNVFSFCLTVLLRREEPASLKDLYDFVSCDEEHEFAQLGKNDPIEAVRDFFTHDFFKDRAYKTTKASIRGRIMAMRREPMFERMITGKSTIDLENAMNTGKILLIDISKGECGEEVALAVGRLILAKLQYIATKRARTMAELEIKPFIVMLDEAQNYVNDTVDNVLSELRKYGFTLILAHQYLKQLEPKIRESIGGNTRLKFIGANTREVQEPLAKQAGINTEKLAQIEKNRFCVKDIQSRKDPFILINPMTLADTQNPRFYLPYDEIKKNGRKSKVYSEEQKELLRWMVEESGYYKNFSNPNQERPKSEQKTAYSSSEKNTESNKNDKSDDDAFIPKYEW